jgi:hypothetical protein
MAEPGVGVPSLGDGEGVAGKAVGGTVAGASEAAGGTVGGSPAVSPPSFGGTSVGVAGAAVAGATVAARLAVASASARCGVPVEVGTAGDRPAHPARTMATASQQTPDRLKPEIMILPLNPQMCTGTGPKATQPARLWAGAAQEGANAHQELPIVDRHGLAVVGPGVEYIQHVGLRRLRQQHQHRHARGVS